jgi:hypothetical protein
LAPLDEGVARTQEQEEPRRQRGDGHGQPTRRSMWSGVDRGLARVSDVRTRWFRRTTQGLFTVG